VDTYAGKAQADTEDLLGNAGYVALVNAAYGLTGTSAIVATDAGGKPVAGRIVRHVEQLFPAPKPGETDFNHTTPADWLVRQGTGYALTDEAASLDRFERLFADLNKLLESAPDKAAPGIATRIGKRAAAHR
jgi:hypothetical protein